MTCLTYLLSVFLISFPAAMASKGLLLPRGYFPSSYLDACDVNCTLTQREHILCTVDCPPIIGVLGSGTAYRPQPTGGVAPIANFSLPTSTITQYITTIPPYCLPGGPGAPIPNVPTVSIPEASLIPTTPVPSLDVGPVVTPAMESLIPAAVLGPIGTAPTPAQAAANSTVSLTSVQTSQTVAVQPIFTPSFARVDVSSQGAKGGAFDGMVAGGVVVLVLIGVVNGMF